MPTVEANEIDLYYERRGDGPPVIFLHGMGLDHRYWPEVTEPLTDDYETFVLDMRLHGRSGGDPGEDISVDTYADDLHAFVDELGLDIPAIVGHSMGGILALRYVDQYPDDVSAVVTLGSETPDRPTLRTRLYDRLVWPIHDRILDRFGDEWSFRYMSGLAWLTRDTATLSDLEEFERIITDHHDEYPEPTDSDHEAIEDALDSYSELGIDYESITTPFLAMYGDRELAIIRDHARYIAEQVPTGQAVEIPDAAHVSMVDNSDFVLDTIREFLDGHVQTETANRVGE